MNSPLVSIYITNFNYGQFIKKAIDSVLNQSYSNIELIIIDDGSTDHSKEIIESYQHHPTIQIIYQTNRGLNVTNNVAIRASNGKYIMRLDADDFLDASAIEKMTGVLETHPEIGLVFPDYYYIDEEDQIIGQEKRHDFDNEVTLYDQPAHGACTLIRKDNLIAVGGYNESYNCQDGYELWVKFINHFKVTNYSEPLFYYRQHGKNLTRNENRILDTRASINANYIKSQRQETATLAIIPVRGNEKDAAFIKLNGVSLLERKIEAAMHAENIKKIVISSPNQKVEYLLNEFKNNNKPIEFHHRKSEQARYNTTLNPAVDEILQLEIKAGNNYAAIVILTVEYPFVPPHKIDDAIHTLLLFGSDALIGVRADNSVFYQHHGDGLHPIMNRDKYTKLEREALFKQVGGINVVKTSSFEKSKAVITGKIGHMVMDQRSSLGIFSDFDLEMAQLIANKIQ